MHFPSSQIIIIIIIIRITLKLQHSPLAPPSLQLETHPCPHHLLSTPLNVVLPPHLPESPPQKIVIIPAFFLLQQRQPHRNIIILGDLFTQHHSFLAFEHNQLPHRLLEQLLLLLEKIEGFWMETTRKRYSNLTVLIGEEEVVVI